MNLRTPARLAATALAATLIAAQAGEASPYDLADAPVPTITGAELVTNMDGFVNAYPHRTTGSPADLLASQYLQQRAAGFGYDAKVEDFPLAAGLPGTGPIRAVTAFKEGTDKADEVILFIAHYDILPQSVQGAYDNGSGVTMLLGLAESLAEVETSRSIMFAWYNGEEEGVLGSGAHVKKLKAEGIKIEAVLGFDMVGLSWPVKTPNANSCLCMWHGDDDAFLAPLLKTVNNEFLGFPEGNPISGGVKVVGNNNRNSDERSFESAGATTLRWAGIRTAAGYPQYHMPQDSMQTIYDYAGGRSFFEDGMRNTLLSAYYSALALDTVEDLQSNF